MDYGVVNFQWRLMQRVGELKFSWASFSNTYVITSDLPLSPELAAEATSFAAGFMDDISGILGGEIYAMLRTRTRQGGPFLEIDDELWLDDGGFVAPAPYWCSVLVRKYSGDPERYRKGRAYIPFIGEPIGRKAIITPYDTDFQGVADKFAQTFTSGTMVGVPVVHNAATDSWEPVTRCDISPFLAFQRRRNASTRYYEIP